jgi:hypothetical protein
MSTFALISPPPVFRRNFGFLMEDEPFLSTKEERSVLVNPVLASGPPDPFC